MIESVVNVQFNGAALAQMMDSSPQRQMDVAALIRLDRNTLAPDCEAFAKGIALTGV